MEILVLTIYCNLQYTAIFFLKQIIMVLFKYVLPTNVCLV